MYFLVIFPNFHDNLYFTENENIVLNPQKTDFKNLDTVLWNIERLRCDDNSIVPVALANKLISLYSHLSSSILEKFVKKHTK